MKRWSLVLGAFALLAAGLGLAAAPEEQARAAAMLTEALRNTSAAGSFHASATIGAGATAEGWFGQGSMDLRSRAPDGTARRRIYTPEGAWISSDDGQTWSVDAEPQQGALLSQILTMPVNPASKPDSQGAFRIVGDEVLQAENVTRVGRDSDDPQATPMDFWLVKDAKRGWLVRKARVVLAFEDGDAPATIVYSGIGEGKPIEKPAPGE